MSFSAVMYRPRGVEPPMLIRAEWHILELSKFTLMITFTRIIVESAGIERVLFFRDVILLVNPFLSNAMYQDCFMRKSVTKSLPAASMLMKEFSQEEYNSATEALYIKLSLNSLLS
jgi:uncharacterized membrane protein YtjA (UPF0391 family)